MSLSDYVRRHMSSETLALLKPSVDRLFAGFAYYDRATNEPKAVPLSPYSAWISRVSPIIMQRGLVAEAARHASDSFGLFGANNTLQNATKLAAAVWHRLRRNDPGYEAQILDRITRLKRDAPRGHRRAILDAKERRKQRAVARRTGFPSGASSASRPTSSASSTSSTSSTSSSSAAGSAPSAPSAASISSSSAAGSASFSIAVGSASSSAAAGSASGGAVSSGSSSVQFRVFVIDDEDDDEDDEDDDDAVDESEVSAPAPAATHSLGARPSRKRKLSELVGDMENELDALRRQLRSERESNKRLCRSFGEWKACASAAIKRSLGCVVFGCDNRPHRMCTECKRCMCRPCYEQICRPRAYDVDYGRDEESGLHLGYTGVAFAACPRCRATPLNTIAL